MFGHELVPHHGCAAPYGLDERLLATNRRRWGAVVGQGPAGGDQERTPQQVSYGVRRTRETTLIEIREEHPRDVTAIRDMHKRAFGQDQEGNIVDALRSNGAALLSMVATLDGRVVGHIIYSSLSVGDISGAALGPIAVLPEHQRQGIGSRLVETGNRKLKEAGCPFVVVVGHADYYPRFGFRPASSYGIACEWEVPDNVFMVLVLDPGKMHGVSGLAKYRPEFSTVS
jgi:putative acetyltransferase